MEKEIKALQGSKPQKRIEKYTVDEFFNSLYYECCDSDDNYDGYLHIVSDIDGKETQIKIKDIIQQGAKYQNKD